MSQLSIPRITMSDLELVDILWKDVLTMLRHRVYHGENGTVPLVNPEEAGEALGEGRWRIQGNDGRTYSIRIILDKVKSIAKNSPVADFVKDEPGAIKILIAGGFNKNVYEYARTNDVQLLTHQVVRLGIVYARDQPEFTPLSEEEGKEVFREWDLDHYSMKRFMANDPVVLYYGLQPGDVVRITRPSPTAGYAIDYRYVSYDMAKI